MRRSIIVNWMVSVQHKYKCKIICVDKSTLTTGIWIAAGVFLLLAVFEVWLTSIVHSCYQYLRDKLTANKVVKYTPINVELLKQYNHMYPAFLSSSMERLNDF